MSTKSKDIASVLMLKDSRADILLEKPRNESELDRRKVMAFERAAVIFCEHEGLTSRTYMRSSQFSSSRSLEIKTSLRIYFRFLFYHLLYFWILGPFIVLVFWPFSPSKYTHLFSNLSMNFRCGRYIFIQLINWLCVIQTIYLLFSSIESPNSLELFYSVLLHTFLRSSSIAIKYTTFSKYQLTMLEIKHIDFIDMQKEHTMADWRKQKDGIVDEMIDDAIHFAKVHTSSFFIKFFVQPQQCTVLELRKGERRGIRCDSSIDSKVDIQPEILTNLAETEENQSNLPTPTYFSGAQVFKFILNTIRNDNKIFILSVLVAIIRTFLPIALDRIIFSSFTFINCPYKNTWLALLELNLALFVFVNIGFYAQAIMDIKRRRELMKRFKLMLNPYMEKTTKTSLPIVDLLDTTSIYGWRSLYTVNLEYGKKFFVRHTMFMPIVVLTLGLCIGLFYIATSYVTRHMQEDSKFVDLLIVTMTRISLDIFILLLMTAKLLIISASFNQLYQQPVELLRSLVYKFENIVRFSDDAMEHYIEKDEVVNALCIELRKRYPDKSLRQEFLKDLIKYYHVTIDSLDSEMKQNVLKIANMRISKRALSSVAALLIPAILTVQKSALDAIMKRMEFKTAH